MDGKKQIKVKIKEKIMILRFAKAGVTLFIYTMLLLPILYIHIKAQDIMTGNINKRDSIILKDLSLIEPPKAEQIEEIFQEHGNKRVDKYFWLRNAEDPKVITYLNAENEYTERVMKHTEPLQENLYNEMVSRIKQDEKTVPYLKNSFYYYLRYEKGFEYPFYCRTNGIFPRSMPAPLSDDQNANEEILLNVNEMAKGYKLFKVGSLKASPDNRILAYSVDTAGNNKYILFFKDLVSGITLTEVISNISGTFQWANDSKTVYYSILDTTNRSYKIMKHILGTNPVDDAEIYHEEDPEFEAYVDKTKSGDYILIECESKTTSETWFIDADEPSLGLRLFQKRENKHIYSVDHVENKFYIRTNADAVNYKLVSAPVNNTQKEYWKDVLEYNKENFLESFELFSGYVVLSERVNGLTRFRVLNLKDNSSYNVEFPEDDYEVFAKDNHDVNIKVLRFVYTSLKTPISTYDCDLVTREKVLLKQEQVLGSYNPKDYVTERVFATAGDGTEIPVSLVYKKGLLKNGKNPLLLSGYGAYGISSVSIFSSERISLLDRGFIFAVSHIRGGEEMGRQWYEDGKLLKKMNSFTDFIACAEFLIKENYTNPDMLFANGRSAGGLLVSTVANMKPDLFKGIIAEVPWVDVIADMLDESIPLTTLEYDEWGNPTDKTFYDYMLSYSPYDNITAKDYPAILATGALNDSQVMFWNPARWTAKLRELKTDNNLLLLKINMSTGHSGKSGRFERFRETAFKYAFMLDQVGVDK